MLAKKAQIQKDKVKEIFDRRKKENDFQSGDLVLRWDARREEKGKHGKFDNFWFGPFRIVEVLNNNTFVLQNLDNEELSRGPINGCFLKKKLHTKKILV